MRRSQGIALPVSRGIRIRALRLRRKLSLRRRVSVRSGLRDRLQSDLMCDDSAARPSSKGGLAVLAILHVFSELAAFRHRVPRAIVNERRTKGAPMLSPASMRTFLAWRRLLRT